MPVIRSTYSLRTSIEPVHHALDHAGVVAEVDEGQVLAVLAAAPDPAADGDLGALVRGAELAAVVGAQPGGLAHRSLLELGSSHGARSTGGATNRFDARFERLNLISRFNRSNLGEGGADGGDDVVGGHRELGPLLGPPQVAEAHDALGLLLLADDDGHLGAGAVGHLHLGPHRAVVEGPVGPHALAPQHPGQVAGHRPAGQVDDEDLDLVTGGVGPDLVAGPQQRLDRRAPAHAGGGGPAQILDHPLVAAPGHQHLVVVGLELEHDLHGVGRPAGDPVVEQVVDPRRPHPLLDLLEVGPGVVGETVERAGGAGQQRAGGHIRAGQDAQRGRGGQPPIGLGQLVAPLGQPGPQGLDVAPAVRERAQAVEHERRSGHAQAVEQVDGDGDHLDVQVRIGRAEGLEGDLVALHRRPVAVGDQAGLERPDLPRRGRPVLGEGPGGRGGDAGREGEPLVAAGRPHLDDGLVAHDVADQVRRLHQRAAQPGVAGPGRPLGHLEEQVLPPGRVGGHHVLGPPRRVGWRALSHRPATLAVPTYGTRRAAVRMRRRLRA